jgi:hypothetical protein
MLISVMELIGEGMINSNQIEFSEELEGRFKRNWQRYVGESEVFKPNAGPGVLVLLSKNCKSSTNC